MQSNPAHAGYYETKALALHPLKEDFWPLFWKIHAGARAADAGQIKRPPIS
jgi:hypothetical protein